MVGGSSIPHWLQILLREKFFNPCMVHVSEKKNEKNIFCLDCCISICLHCLPSHRPHRLLQIRRYVYHDVIRLGDAQKLMNCSLVQPYTTNSAKVVFLNKRPMTRPFKSSGNFCMKCERSLQDTFLFCSLSCRVDHLVTTHEGNKQQINKSLLPLIAKTRNSSYPDNLHDGEMTPDSILPSPSSFKITWSDSTSGSGGGGGGEVSSRTMEYCTATTESVKRKKNKMKRCDVVLVSPAACRQKCSSNNRRKSVPHRAPLN